MYQKTIQDRPARAARVVRPAGGTNAAALDASLGFALLKDRRICIRQKTRALATGAAIVAGLIMMAAVAAHFVGAGSRYIDPSLDGVALAAGTLLFGALLLKRLAPRVVVSQVRCERYRVIPLRQRTVEAVVQRRPVSNGDALAALGYSYPTESREYAVIPRRTR